MADFYASYPATSGGGSGSTGDLTDVGTDGIVITGGTGAVNGSGTQIAQHVADASHNGYLSSTDWSTFNSKQNALTNPLTRLSVDTGSGRVQSKDLSANNVKFVDNSDPTKTVAFNIAGATAGMELTLSSAHSANRTVSFPNASTNLLGDDTTQTVTNKTIDADNNTITNIENADIKSAAAIALNKLAATTVSRALVSDGSGFVSAATTTATEIGFVNGVTSAIQTQLNAKQATGNYITALTGDVAASGPGSAAATIQAGAVDNGKVSASAAIAFSKLATLTSANILVGNVSNVAASVAVTGDISLTNAGVTAYSGTVPLNKGGTGQTTKAPAFDALSPMTTSGDIIYGGASGTGTRLAKGSDTQVLTLASGLPTWATGGVFTPTGLTDIQATALGYKFYSSGTSYSGGNSPTITLVSGGGTLSSVTYSRIIPRLAQDGSWLLGGNFRVTVSSAARTQAVFDIDGGTGFSFEMAVNGQQTDSAADFEGGLTSTATAIKFRIVINHQSATTTGYVVSFSDLPTLAKPNWAYS